MLSPSTLFLLLLFVFSTNCREVTLSTGPIEGVAVGSGFAFLGIPYADPPVNELRFRPPQKIQAWTEVRPAQNRAKSCIFASSLERTIIPAEEQSEDCLYLNVFSNEDCIANKGCKVMVYIHGGYHGTSHLKDDVLIENFLGEGRNVMVVTVSYRLGILGNINLVPDGDSSAARNIALLDIIAALQWVHQEIYYFGGDPTAITLIGHDTGALNVYHLLLSPTYRNLFSQAGLMSGYDIQGELYRNRNTRSSRALAESALCADSYTDYSDFEQTEMVVGCLRNLTAEDLVNLQLNVERQGHFFLGNVLDGHILPGSIDYLLGKQTGTTLMVGCSGNENELAIVENGTVQMDKLRYYCEIVAKERNYRYLTRATADCVYEYSDVSKAQNVKNDLYYFRSAWNVAKSNAEAGGTSRLYEFSPRKELRKESNHDDLLTYLFGYQEGELDDTDIAIRKNLAKTFTDFINGAESEEEWPVFPSYYLIDYNADLEVTGAQNFYKTEAVNFWNEHIERAVYHRDRNYRIERDEEPWLKEIEESVEFGGLLVADRFNNRIIAAVITIVVCIVIVAIVILLAVLSHLSKRDKPERIVYSTPNSGHLPR